MHPRECKKVRKAECRSVGVWLNFYESNLFHLFKNRTNHVTVQSSRAVFLMYNKKFHIYVHHSTTTAAKKLIFTDSFRSFDRQIQRKFRSRISTGRPEVKLCEVQVVPNPDRLKRVRKVNIFMPPLA